jgi:aquaporin PIP
MESKKDTFGREKVIFIYEFFGTALFVYLINMCQGNLFAVPMFLFILGIIAGPISGALFNPAVAIGKFLVHEDPRKEALTLVVYLAAQFSGGLMGFFMSYSSVFNIE